MSGDRRPREGGDERKQGGEKIIEIKLNLNERKQGGEKIIEKN